VTKSAWVEQAGALLALRPALREYARRSWSSGGGGPAEHRHPGSATATGVSCPTERTLPSDVTCGPRGDAHAEVEDGQCPQGPAGEKSSPGTICGYFGQESIFSWRDVALIENSHCDSWRRRAETGRHRPADPWRVSFLSQQASDRSFFSGERGGLGGLRREQDLPGPTCRQSLTARADATAAKCAVLDSATCPWAKTRSGRVPADRARGEDEPAGTCGQSAIRPPRRRGHPGGPHGDVAGPGPLADRMTRYAACTSRMAVFRRTSTPADS